ncbi:prolipoprotein diacylglyceryl transferase [Mordavella massiliensis]|jgi:phosphatidylglycerol:prolipoprotein diacylglycerol transferase|uniref:Phosphatidylglycerol--prolipoprotein diacylglyceryl transferase n=1 Tax=Mordavella massiliensis TaxID=1871024 RepID=A0A938X186_9CLOT|nr:prolipoprotein diacylglyceryl transferase [Mordavella massiliensis]MBM6826537.1 prolipoprotein diacylglyceryl transferase [Mordavella massiliensis]HJB85869.1 prolipoprotein diacylglyceryl transferase [Candidatus Dorea faecigallinarum]
MHTFIDFPHLGIHLENVGKTITLFGIDIAYYGITIAIGMLAGIFVATQVAKRTGQKQDDYVDLAIFGIIFGVIGARIYFVIFSWDMYKDNLLEIFNTRHGGLAIYGGVIAAVITVFVVAHVKKIPVGLMLDTGGCGLITGQMIGRWGNFFNREAFGEYTDGLFAMRLPLDAVRSGDVTEKMREHMETIDGVSCIQVSPTFLYESVWCLLVLILLLVYTRHKKFNGEVFLIYLAGYGAGRFWIESLRTDQLLLPGTAIPVSQLLAGVLVIVSVLWIIWGRRRQKHDH